MHLKVFAGILFLISTVCYGQSYEKQIPPAYPAIPFRAQTHPDRILMSITDTLAQTRTITWRTNQAVQTGELQWSANTGKIDFYKSPRHIPASSARMITFLGDTVYYHTATLHDLQPGKSYVFRVGNDPYWSEWFDTKIAAANDSSFQFVYLGDAQNDVYPLWSRVLRKANQYAPHADFIVHAGDLINHSQNEYEWAEWFRAGDHIFASKPQLAVAGNHEYVKNEQGEKEYLTPNWDFQFKYPISGFQPDRSTYYLDYKNCRFVFLDSNGAIEQQAHWLTNVLKNNQQKWSIVLFHHPLMSAATGRANEGILKEWEPILNRYQVDLVLQGHDHVYGRGRLLDQNGRRSGTTYVVSMAGRKAYEVGNAPWMEVKAGKTQTFQLIEVSDHSIEYKAYTLNDTVLDAFRIIKADGQPQVIETKK